MAPPRRSTRARPPQQPTHDPDPDSADTHTPPTPEMPIQPPTVSAPTTVNGKRKRADNDVAAPVAATAMSGDATDNDNETRCPCGRNADEDAGYMIQCDRCHKWQHGACMGYPEEKDCPENYDCEVCKPELYDLKRLARLPRASAFKHKRTPSLNLHPVVSPLASAHGFPPPSPAFTHHSHHTFTEPASPLLARPKSPKRRATMNSSAAAFDAAAAQGIILADAAAAAAETLGTIMDGSAPPPAVAVDDNHNRRKRRRKNDEEPEGPAPLPTPPTPRAMPAAKSIPGPISIPPPVLSAPSLPAAVTRARRGGPSPNKRGAVNGHGKHSKASGSASNRDEWGDFLAPPTPPIPDHLAHLAHLLIAAQPHTPSPLNPSAATSASNGNHREAHPAKIRWPPKRTTVGEMRRRVRGMLEWCGRQQTDALDRQARARKIGFLNAENGAGRAAESTLQTLNELTMELIAFQERFGATANVGARRLKGAGWLGSSAS